jgi:hypothetical protein
VTRAQAFSQMLTDSNRSSVSNMRAF